MPICLIITLLQLHREILLLSLLSISSAKQKSNSARHKLQVDSDISYSPRLYPKPGNPSRNRIGYENESRTGTDEYEKGKVSDDWKGYEKKMIRENNGSQRNKISRERYGYENEKLKNQRIRQDNTSPVYWVLAVVVKLLSYLVSWMVLIINSLAITTLFTGRSWVWWGR